MKILATIPVLSALLTTTLARADVIETRVQAGSGCSNTGTTSASCSFSNPFGETFTASARGSLSTGTFGASASTLVRKFIGNINDGSAADVLVRYNFGISGGPKSGTLVVSGSVIGADSFTLTNCVGCLNESIVEGAINTGGSPFEQFAGGATSMIAPSGTATPFSVSLPLSDAGFFQLDLVAAAGCTILGQYDSCSATADFMDTLTITGASVFDDSGTLVPGATVISSGGFDPNAHAAVPEPWSLLLGCTVLFLCRNMLRRDNCTGSGA
jgi:hypothetical protein